MSERLDPDTLVLCSTSVFHRIVRDGNGKAHPACNQNGFKRGVRSIAAIQRWRAFMGKRLWTPCRRAPCFPAGVHID